MTDCFKEASRLAQDCGLIRTQLHTLNEMVLASRKIGDFENALRYDEEHRRLTVLYDNQMHLEKVTELDKRYQMKEKEARLLAQDRQLQRSNFLLTLSIGVSAVAVLLLALGFFFRRQRRQYRERRQQLQFTRQLLQHTEQERRRIAANLHDGLGHELLGLKLALGQDQAGYSGRIDDIINEVRSISRHLHPVMLDKIGLKLSIEHLCERMMEHETLFVSADIDYRRQLHPDQELQLYRIVQEALTNIEKYASAEAARVEIHSGPTSLSVCIRDNGRGFAVDDTLAGTGAFGLHSIIERGSVLGAQVRITSGAQGTRIHFEIPIASCPA